MTQLILQCDIYMWPCKFKMVQLKPKKNWTIFGDIASLLHNERDKQKKEKGGGK